MHEHAGFLSLSALSSIRREVYHLLQPLGDMGFPLTEEPLEWCRYVTGDFRFRFGYCKSNPRKMVKARLESFSSLRACGLPNREQCAKQNCIRDK